MNRKLFSSLWWLHLSSPRGLARFVCALASEGTNLMAMLRFTKIYYAKNIAVNFEEETVSYADLYCRAQNTAAYFYSKQNLRAGMRVAVLCRNHLPLLYTLFGLSSIGAHAYLLNLDMSIDQLSQTLDSLKIDACICDDNLKDNLSKNWKQKTIITSEIKKIAEIENFQIKYKKKGGGALVVLSGGTSGNYHAAKRKPSVFNFLYPFFALIETVHINEYKSAYIAPPIYHGFGLAAVIVSLLMGKTIYISNRFSADDANTLVNNHNIDLLVAVPTMLHRMLRAQNAQSLKSLRCILSGGAPLDEKLVHTVENVLGQVLYNLYGTTEAGFFVLATPDDLHNHPLCIGRPIHGVKVKISEPDANGIGTLCVKSAWAMDQAHSRWQSTGDRALQTNDGIIFLKGRADNMILSGGENVYPEDVEHILLQHPNIEQTAIIAVPSPDFGQVMHAFVIASQPMQEEEIKYWLKPQIARYQMPQRIFIVDELPTLETGKVAKKRLGDNL